MAGDTQLSCALRRRRIDHYKRAYPQIMSVLSPKLLEHIPLASVSKKYLVVLLGCEACLTLSGHFKACGYLRAARETRAIGECSAKAMSAAADSYRGALPDLVAYGQPPRGWKHPQLPHIEIRMQPALRDGDAGKRISDLDRLRDKGRTGWLRRPVETSECVTVPGRHGASVRLSWRS